MKRRRRRRIDIVNNSNRFNTVNCSQLVVADRVVSDLKPYAATGYDLGSTTYRWDNLYVNDLQLSNVSKKDTGGNDIDGTWGDWTLQEGESDVYMINNRSGKKFRIKMEEVE